MTPFKLDLTVTKGITFGPILFTFKDSNGDPFDLTGWQPHAHARSSPGAKSKIDLAPAITDAAAGEAEIPVKTDEVTLSYLAGELSWDLILESPGGVRIGPLFKGDFLVKEIITHG